MVDLDWVDRVGPARAAPGKATTKTDAFDAYVAIIAQNFNARLGRGNQSPGVRRIQVRRGVEQRAIGALDHVEHHRPRAAGHFDAQVAQVAVSDGRADFLPPDETFRRLVG
jgi:hypothetical protein